MKCNLINENFYNNYVDNLLKARGVVDVEAFKDPGAEYLQDPENLKNIGMAAALYLRIVQLPNPKILIVVD